MFGPRCEVGSAAAAAAALAAKAAAVGKKGWNNWGATVAEADTGGVCPWGDEIGEGVTWGDPRPIEPATETEGDPWPDDECPPGEKAWSFPDSEGEWDGLVERGKIGLGLTRFAVVVLLLRGELDSSDEEFLS